MNRIAEAERELNRTVGTHLERSFDVLWVQNGFGIPLPIKEYVFAPPRRFRFDRCWPLVKVACELEGGIFMQLSGGKSRHTYPPGFINDLRKYNLAASKGWLVFRFSRGMLDESDQLGLVAHAIWGRLKTLGLTVSDLTSEQQKGLGDCDQ